MIKVYAMNVADIDIADEKLLKKMSAKRLEKLAKMRVELKKKQAIGAELLLNYALGNKSPVEWQTDENGKLFIPNCSTHVNLSHSGNYAVCAVADTVVGIDIQKTDKANFALAKRFFTSDECDYINSAQNSNDAFYDIWVKKESFIKAVGKGLAIPLSSFATLNSIVEYEGLQYTFKKYSVSDSSYKICVCTQF
jgi:4'-phosphopantetheinyl transferase